MRLEIWITATVVAATLLLSTPALTAAPAIQTVSTGLRATGITPGGDAVWFGVTIDTAALTRLRNRHAAIVRDTDGDGAVLYDLPQVSRFAVLFVFDTTTGEHAVFRGEGVDEESEYDLRGKKWRAELEDFDVHADAMELLLVRPGDGAWTMSAREGGGADGDGRRNGKFRLKMREMASLSASPGPQGNVRRGDLLVIIDARTLAAAVVGAKE